MTVETKLTYVLAAVIRRDASYLIAKRPAHKRHGGLWEFPGGKLEQSEDHLSAARRELQEELGVQVGAVGPVLFEQQDPGSQYLIQFIEVQITGEPQALEHEAVAWVPVSDLQQYSLAPSDWAFVLQLVRDHATRP
jgi:8-oxo-dGTP diphosphatase